MKKFKRSLKMWWSFLVTYAAIVFLVVCLGGVAGTFILGAKAMLKAGNFLLGF
jgi:hypothetical protein